MRQFLVLRLSAPLMSFGAEKVDTRYVTRRFPGRSMLTGLLGNALGYHHRDTGALQRLQRRVQYVVREDRAGRALRDYHTVDLGQEHMLDARAWTTFGRTFRRAGGNSTGTHLTERDYLVGAVYTVVLWLVPAEDAPTLEALERALRTPARPLFLGRKCCLPSRPLVDRDSLHLASGWQEVLEMSAPGDGRSRTLWREAREDEWADASVLAVCDDREWSNGIHVGQRFIKEVHVHE